MVTKRQVANQYRKAAQWLEDHPGRWVQGKFKSGNKYCALGCFYKDDPDVFLADIGMFGTPNIRRSTAAEEYALGSYLNDYNDAPGRTVSEVVSGLRRIARALEHGAPL